MEIYYEATDTLSMARMNTTENFTIDELDFIRRVPIRVLAAVAQGKLDLNGLAAKVYAARVKRKPSYTLCAATKKDGKQCQNYSAATVGELGFCRWHVDKARDHEFERMITGQGEPHMNMEQAREDVARAFVDTMSEEEAEALREEQIEDQMIAYMNEHGGLI